MTDYTSGGRIVYRPTDPKPPTHRCDPPKAEVEERHGLGGWVTEVVHPVGTVWQCYCGQTWVVRDGRYGNRFRREGKLARFARQLSTGGSVLD